MITMEQVLKAVPETKQLRIALFLPHLNSAMAEFDINTPLRQAAFLAQVFHESGCLGLIEENLNYSAEALCRTWPSRFDAMAAVAYARQPEKIANRVYANRMGNRDEASGDGWKYRGAGLLQITGKDNQFAAALALFIDPTTICEYLRSPEGAARASGWFWGRSGANRHADKGDFDGVSDVVNIGRKTDKIGDAIGYADRERLYKAFKKMLGV